MLKIFYFNEVEIGHSKQVCWVVCSFFSKNSSVFALLKMFWQFFEYLKELKIFELFSPYVLIYRIRRKTLSLKNEVAVCIIEASPRRMVLKLRRFYYTQDCHHYVNICKYSLFLILYTFISVKIKFSSENLHFSHLLPSTFPPLLLHSFVACWHLSNKNF